MGKRSSLFPILSSPFRSPCRPVSNLILEIGFTEGNWYLPRFEIVKICKCGVLRTCKSTEVWTIDETRSILDRSKRAWKWWMIEFLKWVTRYNHSHIIHSRANGKVKNYHIQYYGDTIFCEFREPFLPKQTCLIVCAYIYIFKFQEASADSVSR